LDHPSSSGKFKVFEKALSPGRLEDVQASGTDRASRGLAGQMATL